jgi:uncharacterized Zn-binding protein involved in type VI secretion/predicted nucleotidyltransferase
VGGVYSTLEMQAAAQLNDPIAHTSALTGLIAGAILGAVIAVAIVGTGGGAAVLIGAALAGGAAGAGLGEYLGSLSFANQKSGKIARGSPDVFANFKPLARADADIGICSKHGSTPPQIATGSGSVFINGFPAARVKDKLTCGSFILEGSPDVFIGGGQILCQSLTIDSEVPWQVHWLVIGAGLVGALLLGGAAAIPAIVGGFALGIPGSIVLGLVGRYYGDWLSENIGGEPEDWEKTGAFIGAAIGGWLGAKGGPKAWEFIKRLEVEPGSLGANGGNIRLAPKAELDIPQGFSKQQFAKFKRSVRQVAKEAGLPEGELVVQGSRAKGTAKSGSDIDIALRVEEGKFFDFAQQRIGSVRPGTKLHKTLLKAARKGKLSKFDISPEFNQILGRGLESKSPYQIDFSIIKKGSTYDTGPFIPIGDN